MDTLYEKYDGVSVSLPPVETEVVHMYQENEIDIMAQTVWGEARGCAPEEQELVVWCILNRASEWSFSIEEVITQENQFAGYSAEHPIDPDIRELCKQAADDWEAGGVAPVLPPYATSPDYYWFTGDGEHNWFREVY